MKFLLQPVGRLSCSGAANPSLLALFRVAFALVGLAFSIRSLPFTGLVWYGESGLLASQAVLSSLHALWIGVLCLILFGIGGRASWILHLVLATAILDTGIGRSVQEALYLFPAFWMIFAELDRSFALRLRMSRPWIQVIGKHRGDWPAAWPIYLFALHVGLVLLAAGLYKAADPLWQEGVGYYYTFLLPWIRVGSMEFLLDIRPVMYGLNYVALLGEILFIFLFAFQRTRIVAIAILAAMFGQLIFPLRLDFIGWIGLTYVLALLSVERRASRRMASALHERQQLAPQRPATTGLLILACTLIVVCFSFVMVKDFMRGASYDVPPRSSGESESSTSRAAPPSFPRLALSAINNHTLRARRWTLFTRQHTLGIYEYRVIVRLETGEYEPFRVFNPDKTPGPYSAGFVPRYLQALVYPVSDLAHRLTARPDYVPSEAELRPLKALVHFGLARMATQEAGRVRDVVLRISPVLMPERYEGSSKPWLAAEWTDFLSFDVRTGTYSISPPSMTFSRQSRVPGLSNSWLP